MDSSWVAGRGAGGCDVTSSQPVRIARPVMVAIWALAAALAGGVVWWAVAVIGGEQAPARDRVQSSAQVAEALALAERSAATGSPSQAGSASPTGEPVAPTASPDPAATSAPSAQPTAGEQPPAAQQPSTGATPGQAAPVVPLAAQPAPASVVARAWQVSGGQVGASCTGAQIVLDYATPADGWMVQVKHAGPAEIEVKFRLGEGESSLHSTCVGGLPEMQADSGESGDD